MVRMKATALAPVLTLCSYLFSYSWFWDCALYLGHFIITLLQCRNSQKFSLSPFYTVQIEVISVEANKRGTTNYLLACMCAKLLQSSSVQFSRSVMSDSLRPHESQHASLPVHHQLKLMSIEFVMPSSHLILCRPLLLLPPIPPSIMVFSSASTLCRRWPKYWSFSFSISPSNEHPELISFRMDWLDLLAVQGTLKSLLQHHSSKASMLQHSAFFTVQLSHSLQSCPILCDSMDYSPPDLSVHGIFQAKILEWVAMPFSRVSSPPRYQPPSLMSLVLASRFFTTGTTWEAQIFA